MTTNERLLETLKHDERMLTAECAKFTARFNTNPLDALSWSEDTFRCAARLRATRVVLAWLEAMSLEQVVVEVRALVLRGARHPKTSTSPVSNFADQCLTSAFAEHLERLEARLTK